MIPRLAFVIIGIACALSRPLQAESAPLQLASVAQKATALLPWRVPETVTWHRDVEYRRVGDTAVRLDVAVPAGEGPFPVALLVHGGGWTGGDKAGDISLLIAPLAAANFVCVSIDYRLAPEHRWPACRDDVLAAIRWVKAHAGDYQGDPDKIALLGYSAGGHLACFAATVADDTTRVAAVVGIAPLTDFIQELPKRGNILGRAQRGLLDRPQEITPESRGLLHAISPVNHLRSGLPPHLLLHGDADGSVPYEQSLTYQARLRELGVKCDLLTLPKAPHKLADWTQYVPDYADQMVAWLREVLGSTSSGAFQAPPA